MEKDCKIILGKILGEIYEIQGANCTESEGTIYGLKNGFEFVLDEVIKNDYKITTADYDNFIKILNVIYKDNKLDDFKGYYDIEREMGLAGIDRGKAISLFTYFKKKNLYYELIEKLDSESSPQELRKFD